MFNVLVGIQILCVAATFAGLSVLLHVKPSEEQKLMLSAIVCAYLQCLGYLFEMLSKSFAEARIAICVQYIGNSFISIFCMLFILQYCKIIIPSKIRYIFFLYGLIVMINVFLAPHSTLYYSSMKFVESGMYPHMELGHGPLYMVNIAVTMLMILSSMAACIYTYFKRKTKKSKNQLKLLLLTATIPLVVYIAGMAKDSYYFYDPVPAGMAIGCLVIIILVLKQGLFDVVGSAHQHILSAMDNAFVVIDENENLLEANEASKELFPVLKTAKLGFSAPQQIKELFGEDKPDNEEVEINGRCYNIHIQKVYNQENLIGYAAIWFDITESKQHFEEMQQLKIQADNANKEKSNFLARMSHEIRTPMNAIIGYSELILQEDIEEKVEGYALDIKLASNNLLSIINTILDISKIESGRLEIVESDYFTQSLIYDIMSVILIPIRKKRLRFINDIDTRLPLQLYGDSLRIRQVMINLLNNAVKFTERGTITLSLQMGEVRDDYIELIWKVSDTGKGIRSQDMEKIFGQFEQVDKKSNYAIEGTGLGLSISKSLVETMGGTIEVESEYGKGTTFTVRLEQRIVDARPIENISIDGLIREGRVKEKIAFIAPLAKILLVDDNPVNLDVIRGYLKHYKIVPDLSESGREAVELVQSNQYDIIFMDQMMPDMDGIETTDLIRKMGFTEEKLTIIALTANAISGTKEYLMQRGFNDYASKPIGIKTLEELLLKHLPASYIEYQTIAPERAVGYGIIKIETEAQPKELTISGIDMKEGMALCGGSMDAYIEVLKAISQYGEEKIQLMKQYIEEKNYERYVIEAHALKSNAASIGAKEVSQMAKEQEMAGKEGRTEEIDKNGGKLLEAYGDMLRAIDGYLKQIGADRQ